MLGKFLCCSVGEERCQPDSCSSSTFPRMWSGTHERISLTHAHTQGKTHVLWGARTHTHTCASSRPENTYGVEAAELPRVDVTGLIMERCPLKLLQTAALKIRVSYQWGADGAERLLLFTVFPAPSFVSLSLFSHVFLERTVWGSVTDSSVMFMCHLSWLEERDERSGKHRRWWSTTVVCSRINALQFSFCSWDILHWVKNVHGLARALGIGHEQVLDHRLDLFFIFLTSFL